MTRQKPKTHMSAVPMKYSGVEWLGDIPSQWRVVAIKDLGTVVTGTTPSTDHPEYYGDEYMFISPGDLSKGKYITSAEKQLSMRGLDFARVLPKNAVLVSCIGNIGKTGLTTADASAFNQQINAIICNRDVYSEFVYYLMTFGEPYIAHHASQTIIPIINKRDFESLLAILPPLAEQRAIAAYLDRETGMIDSLIAKTERLSALLREKRGALISHAVTKGLDSAAPLKDSGVEWLGEIPAHWDVKRIKMLAMVRRGASPRPIDDPVYFDDEGEYAWVRISDVTASKRYLTATTQRLSELGKSKSVPLEPGELFLSIAGSVGKPIINGIKCCIHDGFVYFERLKQDREFLYYVFTGGELYKGLGKLGTQLNLNTETVGNISVPVPSIAEQRAIADHLDRETAKIDALITKNDRLIELMREKRTALISAAVTGKIDLRNEA